jgi:hypothetical protein
MSVGVVALPLLEEQRVVAVQRHRVRVPVDNYHLKEFRKPLVNHSLSLTFTSKKKKNIVHQKSQRRLRQKNLHCELLSFCWEVLIKLNQLIQG